MKVLRLLTTVAVFAGISTVAAPAAAQPKDPFAYQSPGEQVLQGVIDGLLGKRYNVTDRRAIRRCANAAQAEAWDEFGPRRRDRRGRDWRNYQQMRVTGITNVERRPTGLRVRGSIGSGMLYGRRAARVGDLRFRCNVDYNGRVSNVRVDRNPDVRP